MSNKLLNTVAKLGKESAIKNGSFYCRIIFHQPKVPAKLQEMLKESK